MDRKHKGALAELKATVWLLKQGYEVFRNVSQHGEVDLIALDPETKEILLIDVKTAPVGNKKVNPAIQILEYDQIADTCTLRETSNWI